MISRYLGIEKSQPVSKPCTNNTAVLLYIRYTAQRYTYVLLCVYVCAHKTCISYYVYVYNCLSFRGGGLSDIPVGNGKGTIRSLKARVRESDGAE